MVVYDSCRVSALFLAIKPLFPANNREELIILSLFLAHNIHASFSIDHLNDWFDQDLRLHRIGDQAVFLSGL
jgi:hypothetical protein